jgi:cyanophycin synthetase
MYFSQDSSSAVIAEHQEKNGRTIIVSSDSITLKQGKEEKRIIPIPATVKHTSPEWAPHLSLSAAIGAAWALDIPFNVIEAGVETFVSDASISVGA